MEFFPFFRRPYYYNMPIQNRYNPYRMYMNGENQTKRENVNNRDDTNNYENIEKMYDKKAEAKERSTGIQRIMGFESDDILIIALLLFLYNEGVRDNMLFLSLILLLLT